MSSPRTVAAGLTGVAVLTVVVVGTTLCATAGVDDDADPPLDAADQHRDGGGGHGSVLRFPGADRIRPDADRERLRIRSLCAGIQRHLPAARGAGRIRHRSCQRPLYRTLGARPVLIAGTVTGITGFVLLALAHATAWQVIAAAILINAYISLAYGALPALVVREVEPGETGVATSINAIARTVGASLAAAIVAVLLSRTVNGYPLESSYTLIFGLGAVTGLIGMLLIALGRPRLREIQTIEDITDSRALNHEWG